MKEDNQEYK